MLTKQVLFKIVFLVPFAICVGLEAVFGITADWLEDTARRLG
jgi:hypothetical protein